LYRNGVIAIVPPPLLPTDDTREAVDVVPVLRGWVRGVLLGLALGLVAVFVTAWELNPYDEDGSPRRMETHRQLGLPPCTFYAVTGLPCPSCGMTTSFALLVRGDVGNSLRANAVGTLLALFGLALIPWSLASVACRRSLFVRSLERALTLVVLVLLGLMMLRWALVVGLAWWYGAPFRI
jgi:hypothetical protein